MRLGRLLSFEALVLAACSAAGAAWACEAPRIPEHRVDALTKALGRGSFQMNPSSVIAELTFSAPDAPPAVEIIYAGGDARFAEGIAAEARLLRAPCASAAAPLKSVEFRQVGVVYTSWRRRERAAEPRLKHELDLTEVVRIIKDLKSEHVRFDLREMNCPFAVRFSPFRPYLPNSVEEIAQREPSRAPFLAWLRSITLEIPADMMVTAIGRPSLLYVPCAVLDLS